MSGLCGILPSSYNRDRDTAAFDRGLRSIAHRGRDGLSCFHDENVLIGHALFDTGCNGFALDDDGFAIAFDGRLDNGDVLKAKLRAAGGQHSSALDYASDTRLLLSAYRAFGDDLAAMMLGDFAVAIWNPVDRQIYLARDHLGVKPLFYRIVDGHLMFASEINALIAMRPDMIPARRDEAMRAFVEGAFDEGDWDQTFFEGIHRLLPAHFAVAERGRVVMRRYWQLDPGLPIPRGDVGAEFRALFFQAITRRLRGNAAVGALLSGGLDSSSIVSSLPLASGMSIADTDSFSMFFSDPDIEDERDYFSAVVEKHPTRHNRIDCSAASGLREADLMLAEHGQPPFGPSGSVFRYFLERVRGSFDGHVILHGHGGDEVISNGEGLFGELASNGNWIRLWKELDAIRHVTGRTGPHFRRLIWRRGIRRRIGQLLRWPQRFLSGRAEAQRDPVTRAPDGRERPIEQASHLRKLTSPLFAKGLEILDIDAAHAGIELRMPFLDVELIQFCVTVEANEKWKDGLPRSLIRTAMQDILPEKVRLRTDKHDFTGHLRQSLLRYDLAVIDEAILQNADLILPYCNLAQLRADWSDLKTTGDLDNAAVMRLWRVVMLSRWLGMDLLPDDDLLEAAQ